MKKRTVRQYCFIDFKRKLAKKFHAYCGLQTIYLKYKVHTLNTLYVFDFFDYVISIEAIKYTYNYLNKYVIEKLKP